ANFSIKEDWSIQFHGRTAWSTKPTGPDRQVFYRLELTRKEFDAVLKVLVANQAWKAPLVHNLPFSPSYHVRLNVLTRGNGPATNPNPLVYGRPRDRQQRLQRIVKQLQPLRQRILREGMVVQGYEPVME